MHPHPVVDRLRSFLIPLPPSFIFPREGKRAACSLAHRLKPLYRPTDRLSRERTRAGNNLLLLLLFPSLSLSETNTVLASSKLSPFPSSLPVSGAKKYLACPPPLLPSDGAGWAGAAFTRLPAGSPVASAFLPRPTDGSTISLWRCKCYPRNTRATKCSKADQKAQPMQLLKFRTCSVMPPQT